MRLVRRDTHIREVSNSVTVCGVVGFVVIVCAPCVLVFALNVGQQQQQQQRRRRRRRQHHYHQFHFITLKQQDLSSGPGYLLCRLYHGRGPPSQGAPADQLRNFYHARCFDV